MALTLLDFNDPYTCPAYNQAVKEILTPTPPRTAWHLFRCARCGEQFQQCFHVNTAVKDMSDEEAARVKARYAFGQLHNPDHDTTSYRDAVATD